MPYPVNAGCRQYKNAHSPLNGFFCVLMPFSIYNERCYMDAKKISLILVSGFVACLIAIPACQAGQTTISATVSITIPDFLQMQAQAPQPAQAENTPSFYAVGTPETYSMKHETRWVTNERDNTKQLVAFNTIYPK